MMSFDPKVGATECRQCPAGRFSNTPPAAECSPCPPGTFSAEVGRSSCEPCSPGRFAENEASIECEICSVGRFSDSVRTSACASCPDNHHSPKAPASTPMDQLAEYRTWCQSCPYGATMGPSADLADPCSCECLTGSFFSEGKQCDLGASQRLFSNETRCEECPPLKTTSNNGSLFASDCRCDIASMPTVEIDVATGDCWCPDGRFFNPTAGIMGACEDCAEEGENCIWKSNFTRSLLPPSLFPGFWASTGQAFLLTDSDEEQRRRLQTSSQFAGHSVYKCYSRASCPGENGECARGRDQTVTACALCEPQHFGGPDGECTECGDSTGPTWAAAIAALLLGGPFSVLIAHSLLLSGDDGGSQARGTLGLLRQLRISARQVVKHIQIMALLGGFSVEWPREAIDVFNFLDHISVMSLQISSLTCLVDQQSATFEILTSFAVPVAFVLTGALLSPLMSKLLSMVLTCFGLPSAARACRMNFTDGCKTVFWIITLFFTTIFRTGLSIVTCTSSPNGALTVTTFPHVKCWTLSPDEEWTQLLGPAIAYMIFFVLLSFAVYVYAFLATKKKLEQSRMKERGYFAFLFEDFRNSGIHWSLVLLFRDMTFNVVAAVLNNHGAEQLLLTGFGMLAVGFLCFRQSPFFDVSNTVIEAGNAVIVSSLCIFTAGMGFSEQPGLPDLVHLAEGSSGERTMEVRARALIAFQLISALYPFIILFYQFLLLVPGAERRMPAMMRPLQADEEESLRIFVSKILDVSDGTELVRDKRFLLLLDKMDPQELLALAGQVYSTPAAIGILRDTGSSQNITALIVEAMKHYDALPEEEKERHRTLRQQSGTRSFGLSDVESQAQESRSESRSLGLSDEAKPGEAREEEPQHVVLDLEGQSPDVESPAQEESRSESRSPGLSDEAKPGEAPEEEPQQVVLDLEGQSPDVESLAQESRSESRLEEIVMMVNSEEQPQRPSSDVEAAAGGAAAEEAPRQEQLPESPSNDAENYLIGAVLSV